MKLLLYTKKPMQIWMTLIFGFFLYSNSLSAVGHELLSRLTECKRADCGLNRELFPQRRVAFENKIFADITEQYPNKNTPLSLASFASGGLRQDYELLKKFADAGYSNITIHFYDLLYENPTEEVKTQQEALQNVLPLTWKMSFLFSIPAVLFDEISDKNKYDFIWGIDFVEESYYHNTPGAFEALWTACLKVGGMAWQLRSGTNQLHFYTRYCLKQPISPPLRSAFCCFTKDLQTSLVTKDHDKQNNLMEKIDRHYANFRNLTGPSFHYTNVLGDRLLEVSYNNSLS